MNQKQYEKIIRMEQDLEIINLENLEGSSAIYSDKSIKLNEMTYKIVQEVEDQDLDKYLKIKNAYNLLKIKKYLKIIAIIIGIGAVIAVLALLPYVSAIIQMLEIKY